ncbi:hypothetical protein [Arcobacter sp.]|uniref:hypothetical protein n=1 Tax=unclassified Arcobacter TaxID=2593671 RepID=UPI003B00149C
MSIRPDDFVIYIAELLNIKTESQFTIADMIEDIKTIPVDDLPKFKDFIKNNFRMEKYNFMNGVQKFNSLKQDFDYYTRPRLSDSSKKKVENYSEYLFKKTCWLMDRIAWQIEAEGKDIRDFCMEKTKAGDKLYFSESDLKYLFKIGDKVVIFNLVKRNKPKFESELLKVITVQTLIKYDPRNQIENKTQDQKILEQIKARSA